MIDGFVAVPCKLGWRTVEHMASPVTMQQCAYEQVCTFCEQTLL